MRATATCIPRIVAGVTVNGIDYSKVAFEADDAEGWAKCFKWQTYPEPPTPDRVLVVNRETSKVETVTVHGEVKFIPLARLMCPAET